MNTPRIKRPTLERSGPSRAWTGAFGVGPDGSNGSGPAGAEAADAAARPPGSATAFEAVNDAYRVIDEYLWQGQDLARRLCRPSADEPARRAAEEPPLERWVRSTGELARAWLEVLQGWSEPRSSAVASPASSPPEPFVAGRAVGARERPRPAAAASRRGVAVVVETERRVSVQLELNGDAAAEGWVLGEPGPGSAELPALEGVSLEPAERGGPATVRLRLTPEQPGGVYSVRLLDRTSGAVQATITVSLPRGAE